MKKKEKKKMYKLKEKLKKIKSKKYTFKETIIITLLSLLVGVLITILTIFLITKTYSLFSIRDFNKLFTTYQTIKKNYYGEIDKNELVSGAVSGMLSSVSDDFTSYISSDNSTTFTESVEGKYEGIGCIISINDNNEMYVVTIYDNSPAKEAGLKVGDILKKVNNINVKDKTTSEVSTYIRNQGNKTIKLLIERDGKEKTIKLKLKEIEIPSVSSEIKEVNGKKVGYINISVFSSVTEKQFTKQLKNLEKGNITGLVIDVRDNTGGYLSSVKNILNKLLKKNQIIYQTEKNEKTTKVKDTTKEHREYSIAVLQNKNSASASEILSAAIKESYKGYVVGTNSYGKGTIQETLSFDDSSIIKFTTEKWLTPKGNWINEKGVEPTDYVELSTESDNQLLKALELVSN